MDTLTVKSKYNLDAVKAKKEEIESEMSTGHLTGSNMSALSIELTHYSTLFSYITQLYKQLDILEQAQSLIASETDQELIALAQKDIASSTQEIGRIEAQILDIEIERQFKDPDDEKPAIMEIRAGAGGEEAALFAAELYRMYTLFSKNKGWAVEVIDMSLSENGGYKEIIAHIQGKNVFKSLKYESGVHRVQRVPVTESSGRIHTSTASVAILPEAKDVDVQINPEDLRIDVMRASGAGGQNVNRTDSAVRITHLPSGIVVSCQETKHQDQNKVKAMNILRARLYEKQKMEADQARADMRSSQIGSANRSEKIRTFNFPQNRITDHRVKKSWFNLEEVLNGNLDEILSTVKDMIQKGQVAIGDDYDE
ncbi:peptide chain release factor 1 [bacterium]|nr:peptide chain release factor 1 [bacterium]